jgi:hypothetical protein
MNASRSSSPGSGTGEDQHLCCKEIFTLLMVIMTLAEKSEKSSPPVVTIPAS